MRNFRATALVIVTALLLSGCSIGDPGIPENTPSPVPKQTLAPAPADSSTPPLAPTTSGPQAVDDAFLSSWKTFFPDQTDELAIAQALNICDSFKVGISADEQSTALQASVGVTSGDAAYMIGTALIAYCPEFSGNM